MVPLAVTSTNAMIRRLGAKRWHALHRLAYVVAIAGSHSLLHAGKGRRAQATGIRSRPGGFTGLSRGQYPRKITDDPRSARSSAERRKRS